MKILVFGKNGNISKAFSELYSRGESYSVINVGKDEVDFLCPEKIPSFLDTTKPDVVINAAAYTQVDKAEVEQGKAFAINSVSPGVIARWCAANDKIMVHYSTDYVFSGDHSNKPWIESDPEAPLNAYGRSKLDGEIAIVNSGAKHLIFRTSWIFAPGPGNFFSTMLRLFSERDSLKVVSDQIGSPTFSYSICRSSMKAIERAVKQSIFPSGIYHMSNSGHTSWYGFAEAILKLAVEKQLPVKCKHIDQITSEEYNAPAVRPKNSRLDNGRLQKTFDVELESWQAALDECMSVYLKSIR